MSDLARAAQRHRKRRPMPRRTVPPLNPDPALFTEPIGPGPVFNAILAGLATVYLLGFAVLVVLA